MLASCVNRHGGRSIKEKALVHGVYYNVSCLERAIVNMFLTPLI